MKEEEELVYSFFMWLFLNSILPYRKTLLPSFQRGRAPNEVKIAIVFIRTTSLLKEHNWI